MRVNPIIGHFISWGLTVGALAYVYISHNANQMREAALQQGLSESQQLVLQVSNRLAATEAQLNTLKLTHTQLEQQCSTAAKEPPEIRRPIPAAPSTSRAEKEPTRRPASEPTFGQGVSSFFKRIRQGFSKNPDHSDNTQ